MNPINTLRVLLTCLAGLLVMCTHQEADANSAEITLVIVDLGIRQKEAWRADGDDGLGWIHRELPRVARIAVVMPDRARLKTMSTAELRKSIFEMLEARVSAARAAGNARIEIQLVEDIGAIGYLDQGERGNQHDVDRFGAAAYGAIVDLNRKLAHDGVRLRNEAVLGSNGTKVWAANALNWLLDGKSIWAAVKLFDGRAEVQPAMRAIKLAGPEIVWVFNTRGDIWALDLLGTAKWVASSGLNEDFFFSIANAQTTHAMKDALPAMRVFYLRRDGGFMNEHISGTRAENVFAVSEFLGTGKGAAALPGRFTGQDLQGSRLIPSAPKRGSLGIPKAAAERIALWREVALDLADLLLTYSSEMYEKHRGDNSGLQVVALVAQAQKLHLAIRKEIDDAAGAPVVSLSNEFVESLLRFALGVVDVGARLKLANGEGLKHATLLDGVIDIGAFALSVGSQGTIDADAAKKLRSGMLKLGKDQVLAQARRSLEALHDIPALEAIARSAAATVDDARELASRRATVDGAHRHVASVLLMLDAVPELAGAIMAQRAAGGRWTVDVIDRYSDAVIVLGLSFLVSERVAKVPVLGHFATSARDALVSAARFARDTAKRSPQSEPVRWMTSTERARIYDLYAAYYRRQRAIGAPALTMREYFAGIDLAGAGIRDAETAEVDARVLAENEALALGIKPDSTTPRERQRVAESGPVVRDPAPQLRAPRNESLPPPSRPKPLDPPPPNPPPPPAVAHGPPPPNSPAPARGSSDPPEMGAKVGGVALTQSASTSDPLLMKVEALAFDPASGRLAMVGREGAAALSLNERDLAWALHLQFGPRPQDPQFSLDAADPANVNGPWLKAVYWPQDLKGSDFGEALFTVDHSMKKLGLGVEVRADGAIGRRAAVVPGFASVPDLMRRDSAQGQTDRLHPQWARYWIVSEQMEIQQVDNAVRFVEARMGVRARRQEPDPSRRSGLRDLPTDARSIEAQWAAQLTTRFADVAATLPEFARVVELAKAVAIAKWLKGLRAQVDQHWIEERLRRTAGAGTDRVPALSTTYREESRRQISDTRGTGIETTVRTIRVFGGVDLTVTPTLRDADAQTRELARAVSKTWLKNPDKARFEVEWKGRVFIARVVNVAHPQSASR